MCLVPQMMIMTMAMMTTLPKKKETFSAPCVAPFSTVSGRHKQTQNKKTKDVPSDTDEDDDIIQEESKSFGD